MKDLIFQRQWNWHISGITLGIIFLLAVTLIKPIGVSTQFVIFDGVIWNLFSDKIIEKDSETKAVYKSTNYKSTNPYLNKYAEDIANPVNYALIFVLSMVVGGFIARRMQSSETPPADLIAPSAWREAFGESVYKRYVFAFLGGILVLIGARLAGGCTSGHMMSGMMQTAVSGYLFAIGAFAVAVPVALWIYKKR